MSQNKLTLEQVIEAYPPTEFAREYMKEYSGIRKVFDLFFIRYDTLTNILNGEEVITIIGNDIEIRITKKSTKLFTLDEIIEKLKDSLSDSPSSYYPDEDPDLDWND